MHKLWATGYPSVQSTCTALVFSGSIHHKAHCYLKQLDNNSAPYLTGRHMYSSKNNLFCYRVQSSVFKLAVFNLEMGKLFPVSKCRLILKKYWQNLSSAFIQSLSWILSEKWVIFCIMMQDWFLWLPKSRNVDKADRNLCKAMKSQEHPFGW